MPILQAQVAIDIGANYTAKQESGVPSWTSDNSNKSKWWGGPSTPDREAFYFSHVGNTVYMQYGKNQADWAGTRFFTETYQILNESKSDLDGSVEADIRISLGGINAYRTDYYSAGVPVKTNFKVGGQTVATYTGATGANYSLTPSPNPITVHIKVPALSESKDTAIEQETIYTAGTYPNAYIRTGFSFYNPSEPITWYKPGAVYNNGFQSVDQKGYQKVVKSGTSFTDLGKLNLAKAGESNIGHTRVFKDGNYRQAKRY